ncbi:MAG TPA: glycosyl transferase family 1 [Chloroflexi bacterium]|nr:glycosyl transferase family 1 [Chloroflexota bacterium]
MHILFLTQVLPYPLDAGPKTRAYHVLRYCAAAGHKVTLLTFTRNADRSEYVQHLRTYCTAVHTVPMRRSRARDVGHLLRSLVSPTPFLITRDWVPGMAARVRDVAIRHPVFDVVHADQLWMAPYALLARHAGGNGRQPAAVLDQHNAVFQIPHRLAQQESNPLKRALLAVEGRKLVRYEKEVCRRFDHVVWVTEEDHAALDGRGPNGQGRGGRQRSGSTGRRGTRRFSIIPICVDTEMQPVIPRRPDAFRVTFLGGLHWPPNSEGVLWFARQVWPFIAEQVPSAVLTVIGKEPPRALVEIGGGRSAAGDLPSGVEIPGYVTDPRPYLAETAVFIVPLHAGGGMRVKILDAWCWGLPVVTTRVGAEGLRARDGENALLADTATTFAQAVVRVMRAPEVSMRLAAEGRRTVETFYDWRRVYEAWDDVYAAAMGQRSSPH